MTRSRMTGNVCIGSRLTGSSGRCREPRHTHQLGTPLISAGHDPHLPALQFHDRHIRRLLRLDSMHGVQYDHSLFDLCG